MTITAGKVGKLIMKCITFIVTAVAVASASAGNAQGMDNLSSVVILDGQCEKLVMDGNDITNHCQSKTINAAYKNGNGSFQFLLENDKGIISFFGQDSNSGGSDTAILTVTKVGLNLMMGTPPTYSSASGRCVYTNPFAGPAIVRCWAKMGGKIWEANFQHDGSEPAVKEF